jgi:phosphoglycolate phosphatase
MRDRGSTVRISNAQTRPYISVGGSQMMSCLLAEACGDPENEIREFRARYLATPTPHTSLFPGVREGLDDLHRRGVRLTICSAKPQNLCEKVLGDLGVDHLFSAIVGRRPDAPCKPDPAHLDMVLELVGGERSKSCYIGDSEVDHELADRAQVPFVLMTYGYATTLPETGDMHRLDSFALVPELVIRLLAVGQPRQAIRRAWRRGSLVQVN